MCVSIVLSHARHLLMLINILDHKSSQEKWYSSEEILFSNIKRHRISEEGWNLLWTVSVHYLFQRYLIHMNLSEEYRQICMFFMSQNVQHGGDAQSVDRPDSHFTVYPTANFNKCFAPYQGKEVISFPSYLLRGELRHSETYVTWPRL